MLSETVKSKTVKSKTEANHTEVSRTEVDKNVGRQAAPLTPTEERLRGIWRQVFANPAITADDDFYELDGYSLLAARIALYVREIFGVELPLDEIYRTPTVREVAAYIDRHMSVNIKAVLDSASLVLFKAGSAGLPLFFLHGPQGGSGHYFKLAQHLESERPMYGVDSPHLKSDQPAQCSIPQMAAFCISEMRKIQPQGPYFLIGYSWSGLLALEAAQQLEAAGEVVALLAVLDTVLSYNPAAPPPLRFVQIYYHFKIRRFALLYLNSSRWLRPIKSALGRSVAPPAIAQKATRHADLPKGEDALLQAKRLAAVRQVTSEYHPRPYGGRIAYLRCPMRRMSVTGSYLRRAWTFLARGGIEVYNLPGTHLSIITEPLLAVTSEALDECIRKAASRLLL